VEAEEYKCTEGYGQKEEEKENSRSELILKDTTERNKINVLYSSSAFYKSLKLIPLLEGLVGYLATLYLLWRTFSAEQYLRMTVEGEMEMGAAYTVIVLL
jgi:hypothetical protein